MGPPPPRTGTFSPNNPQALQTGSSHSPHPSLTGGLSAGASPSTSSPTGTSVSKISIAQVYLLLSTIKEDKDDPTKWDLHTEQLRKVSFDWAAILTIFGLLLELRDKHTVTNPFDANLHRARLTCSSSMTTAWKYLLDISPVW